MSGAKTAFRKHYRKARQNLTAETKIQAELAIVSTFIQWSFFKTAQKIGIYAALPEEVDTKNLIQQILLSNKTCYLPVIDNETTSLKFAKYDSNIDTHLNAFGILEPVKPQQFCDPRELDMVLVPLVVVDLRGYRVGMGKGFYDRTFAFLKEAPKFTKPFLLGLGFDLQRVEAIPAEPFDVPLNGLITESGLHLFS